MNTKKKSINFQALLAPSVLVAIYVIFAIIGIFKGFNFFSKTYLVNTLETSYYIGFLAIGVTFVIITGGIDLSLGTTMICGMLLGGAAYNIWHWPIIPSLLFAVLVSTAIGFVNGLLIALLKLPPFIATLGMQMVGMGFGAIVTKVMTMRYPTVGTADGWFKSIFFKTAGGFPIGAIWLLGAFLVAYVILNKTRFGRYTFAIGSNSEAARLSGIRTQNWLIGIYTLCGLFSGLAGIFYASAYTTIIPMKGQGDELLGIAGVVIGGTSMSGGSGSLTGTIIGVFIMSVLKQGLMAVGWQGHVQVFITGIVIIGAVLLDNYRVNAANRVKKA